MNPKLFKLSQFITSNDEAYHFARTTIHRREELSLHYHDFAEIFWIDRGEGIHRINGIDTKVMPGTLFMIRPSDNHDFTAISSTGIRITNLAFKRDTLDHLKNRYFDKKEDYFWHSRKLPYHIQLSSENMKKLEVLADRMIKAQKDKMNLDLFLIRIFQLVESEMEIFNAPDPAPAWLVMAIEQYNHPELFRKGIHGFTKLTEKTIEHTNRSMKRFYDVTLTDFVTRKRMEYAAAQIIMTAAPIKMICEECGYKNLGYFYNAFQKQYKLTPIQYRKINQQII